MTARAPARQSDIRRAIEATRKAGEKVRQVEIRPDGTIVVNCGDSAHDETEAERERSIWADPVP